MVFPSSLPSMWGRCNIFGLKIACFFVLVLVSGIQGCWSLNAEGFALLRFREKVYFDPFGTVLNWNPDDSNPCKWSGIHCIGDEVQLLDLSGLSLEGTLAPELGELGQLRSLVLNNNHLYGVVPKEIGNLTKLELLDLRGNNLSGLVPRELGGILCLRRLLISDNNFEGSIPVELGRLGSLSEFEFDENLASEFGCRNRKFGHCTWRNNLKQLYKADSLILPIKEALRGYIDALSLIRFHALENFQSNIPSSSELRAVQNVENLLIITRRKLVELSANLAAAPASTGPPSMQIISVPSGSFSAVPNGKSIPNSLKFPEHADGTPTNSPHEGSSKWTYVWILVALVILLIIFAVIFLLLRRRRARTVGSYTGLSGQLQRALTKGIPKIDRIELETACEDFSNIINTLDGCTIYKGTLTSGVEIAVASAAILSFKQWPQSAEMTYRKKIDSLSRVNHKNFVNLIGFCEDPEPFSRMMVFEYAPNGSLFEHLHVEEMEHLDWSARMRIIMGIAYCLQYMHHDLTPPVIHPNLNSSAILLTDDYASKVADINFGPDSSSKLQNLSEKEPGNYELPPANLETNVYCFGLLLLEIISGKLLYSKEHGNLVNWAAKYLGDKQGISYLIDPTLEAFNDIELDVVCEVIQECIQTDANLRPSMNDITSNLRQWIDISPEQAAPRLSPLWWAELEILSAETT